MLTRTFLKLTPLGLALCAFAAPRAQAQGRQHARNDNGNGTVTVCGDGTRSTELGDRACAAHRGVDSRATAAARQSGVDNRRGDQSGPYVTRKYGTPTTDDQRGTRKYDTRRTDRYQNDRRYGDETPPSTPEQRALFACENYAATWSGYQVMNVGTAQERGRSIWDVPLQVRESGRSMARVTCRYDAANNTVSVL